MYVAGRIIDHPIVVSSCPKASTFRADSHLIPEVPVKSPMFYACVEVNQQPLQEPTCVKDGGEDSRPL